MKFIKINKEPFFDNEDISSGNSNLNKSINQSFDNEDIVSYNSNTNESVNQSFIHSENIQNEHNFNVSILGIENQIKKLQTRRWFYNLFLLTSAIFITLVILDDLGVQSFIKLNGLSLKLKLTILLPIIISCFIILDFKIQLNSLSQWLSYLKKSQLEKNVQKPELKPSGNKESFMSRIKKITIDAPADFSTNYEKYM